MLLAGFFFSAMVALVKLLGSRFSSIEIVFFRSAVQLVVVSIVLWKTGFASIQTKRPLLHTCRALAAVLLLNCNFYAFTKLPMADVVAIGFSRNLFLVVLAVLVLGEKLNSRRLLATVVGFIGVIVIVRPGSSLLESAAWIALAGAGFGAIAITMIRKLTVTESNIALLFYPAIAIFLATVVPAKLVWITPTIPEFCLLILLSVMGISGQSCLIQAFRAGETIAVAPASYVRLVYAVLLGYCFFSEVPDMISMIGAVIIVCSNLFLIIHERLAHKTKQGERVPGDVT